MDLPPWATVLVAQLTTFGLKLLGAIVVWIVGRRLIAFAVGLAQRALRRGTMDETLTATSRPRSRSCWTSSSSSRSSGSSAWRRRRSPFRTGDFVTAGGVTGTVAEIGLLATVINTPDNVRTIVGNSKILADTISNFSANAFRRVDLVAQLHHTVDPEGAIQRLRERVARIPNVTTDPAPQVEILQFTPAGPLLAVRPSCRNENYWQVYFDTNRAIRETFAGAGYPAPEQLVLVRSGT